MQTVSWLFSKLFLRVSGAEWIAVRQPASYMGFIQWSVKQLCICFKGNGVGERKRKFVHHSLVFFNHCLHACQPACVCVCFFSFDPTMSDAFGPMTRAVCLGSMKLALS